MDWTERVARSTARIIGSASGAAKALADLERRRAAGEDVAIFREGSMWFVGPPIKEDNAPGNLVHLRAQRKPEPR